MQATTNLAQALGRGMHQMAWDGQRSIVPVGPDFIAAVKEGACVKYATGANDVPYEIGCFKLIDGRPCWVRMSLTGESIGRQEMADGELEAKVLRLSDPTLLEDAVMDAVALSPFERAKLASQLSGLVRDLAAIPTGSAMERAKLAKSINALSAQLTGPVLAHAAEVELAPVPDAGFKAKVLDAAYGGKVVVAVESAGYLAAKVNKTDQPVFVIDGTLRRAEFKAMIAEAGAHGLPTEKIYVFCRLATYTGRGIEVMLLRELAAFNQSEEAPAKSPRAQAAINVVAGTPAETDVPGMAVYITSAIYRQQAVGWREQLAAIPVDSARHAAFVLQIEQAEAAPTVESAMKGIGGVLAEGIAKKNVSGLLGILHTGNATSKKAFTQITGVKLPSTDKGTRAAILAWTDVTEEDYAKLVEARRVKRAAAEKPEELRSHAAYTRQIADEVKINYADGTPSTTGAKWIESLIANGQTLLAKSGNGPVKKWGLYQPDTRRGVLIPSTAVAQYAKALIEKMQYEKENGVVLDAVEDRGEVIDGDDIMAHSIDGDEVSLAPA